MTSAQVWAQGDIFPPEVPTENSRDHYTNERRALLDGRVVVWFSCGATSAIAAKITLRKYGTDNVVVVYTDPGGEHPDNRRFLADCERWFGQSVIALRSERYADIWECFEKTRYLAGVKGARCTAEMKKRLRQRFERAASDVQVFGFDAQEKHRAERFRKNNPEVYLETPLIDRGITKPDCLAILKRLGIEIPEMYKLGYRNNNCIGCVKGQAGYWNKIRQDFPVIFTRMAHLERELGAAICKKETTVNGVRKRERVFLDELPTTLGNYKTEPAISCGLVCEEVATE